MNYDVKLLSSLYDTIPEDIDIDELIERPESKITQDDILKIAKKLKFSLRYDEENPIIAAVCAKFGINPDIARNLAVRGA